MARLVMVCTNSRTADIGVTKTVTASSGDYPTIMLGGGHGRSAGSNCCELANRCTCPAIVDNSSAEKAIIVDEI